MTQTFATPTNAEEVDRLTNPRPRPRADLEIGLLTGCQDRPYVFGLATSLATKQLRLDVVGNQDVDGPEMHTTPNLRFVTVRESRRRQVNPAQKVFALFQYYRRLIQYAAQSQPRVLHILWNNKFEFFDRTLLMLYYKWQGKKLVLTAHNVNQGRRDGKDSALNRLTLRIQYRLCDNIFVHTERMKVELLEDFGVPEHKITVIPFGINNAVPHSDLTAADAKRRLGFAANHKAILFFGRLRPYKGLDNLLAAYQELLSRASEYRLLVAGEAKKGSEDYSKEIREMIARIDPGGRILSKIEFIPDKDVEIYFKAADVLVLPYKDIFQSGVMFLAFSFGLPVIAADVGAFKEEIIPGRTGLMCNPADRTDLANTIEAYFESDLYKGLEQRRPDICGFARERHSWDLVADKTVAVYQRLLAQS